MGGNFLGNKMIRADEKVNEKIEEIAKERGKSMVFIAIVWGLSKPFMTASKIERVDEARKAV